MDGLGPVHCGEDTPEGSSDSDSYVPPKATPRRAKKKRRDEGGRRTSDADPMADSPAKRPVNFGLPPTPKVLYRSGRQNGWVQLSLHVHTFPRKPAKQAKMAELQVLFWQPLSKGVRAN